jgi:hypothetical protein
MVHGQILYSGQKFREFKVELVLLLFFFVTFWLVVCFFCLFVCLFFSGIFVVVFVCLFCEYGVEHQFQQYFSYIVAVSSIGGVIRFNRRKPPIRRKSLTNWIPLDCTNTVQVNSLLNTTTR